MRASQLAIWQFQDSASPSNIVANLSAADVSISTGSIGYQNGTDDGGTRIGNAGTWTTGDFDSSGKYLQFSVAPDAGYSVTLTNVTIRLGRTGTGPTAFTIQYSLDGFATAGTAAGSGTITSETVDSLDAFTFATLPVGTQTGTVTFRIWGHNASGTGNLRFNNFRAYGSVAEALGAPTDIHASQTNATAFTAAWEAVSGADQYRLDVWAFQVYRETFDDSPVTGSTYVDGRFTNSINDVVWNYTYVRGEGDYPIEGTGMMLGRVAANSKLLSEPIAGGVLDFSVDLRKAFTGGADRQVELVVNEVSQGKSIVFGSDSGADDTVHAFKVPGIETTGDVTIELRHITGTGSDNRPITIDNLAWTSFEPLAGYSNLLVSGTSQIVSGLNPETTYYFRVRAENDDETSANSVVTNVTTRAPDASSDLIRAADFTEPVGLDYAAYQAASDLTPGNSLEVARFSLRDGGADGDADDLPTMLTSLTFDVTGHAQLRRIAMFDGVDKLAEVASAASISFDGLSVVAPDGGLTNLSLRVTFQQSVTDQAPIQFAITAAATDAGGSTVADADAGGATSSLDNGRNRIGVTATELAFTSIPAAVVVGSNFTVAVDARDLNGNRDLDATDAVTLSLASGVGTLTGGDPQALVEGAFAFTAVQFDTGGTFTLTADAAGLSEVVSGAIEAGDVLEPGDVTVIGYRTSNPDGFAFVTWKHISGGTVLGFWDHSANADGTFRRTASSEKSMTWTAPVGGVTTGTVVAVSCPEGVDPASATVGTVDGKLDGLSQDGDQIFAGVGGTFPPDGAGDAFTYDGTLLYGLNTHAPWLTEGEATASLSCLPPALAGDFRNQAFSTGANNGQYAGERGTYTTWEQYRELIHEPANWVRENAGTTILDTTPFTLGTLADEPTVQASAIRFRDVTPYEAMVSWTPGDGVGRVVLCRVDGAPDPLPADGFPLTANPVLGAGGSLLGDAQVVYVGTGATFRLGGLAPTNTYVLQVFEYNGIGGMVNYLTNSAAANPASLATPPGPPVAPGNLLVHLVDGDGSSLSGAAVRVRIREYTRTGRLVNQWDMPHGESGTRLTATGNSDVEGKLTVAPGGAFAAVVGYDAAAGTADVRTNLTRTIGRLDLRAGEWDFTTTGQLGGDDTARAVAVDDTGTNFWTILNATVTAQRGLRYSELGQTTTGTQLASRDLRGVRLFGGQLYQYGAAGADHGVFRVGDDLPISGTPTITGLSGISGESSGLHTTGFYMADLSDAVEGYDTLWMARYTIGNQIGVTKYSKVEGTWIANSTNQTGEAIVHLDGTVEDGVAHLFIIQGTSAGLTRLMHLADDTGYNQPMTGAVNELAVAGAHQAFRGVAVIPADADDDGLPDWWELGWFGDLDTVAPDAEIGESGVTVRQAYWAGTDPTDPTDVMRITGLDLADATGDDVTLTFHAGAHRSCVIRAASAVDALPDAAAVLLTGVGGTLDWTDTDAFADGPRRFYRLGVEHAGGGYTNIQQWAVFRQPRTSGRQELVSVPVNYPDGGNNLNAALGTHLARGLHASDSEEDADKLRWRDGDGNWVEYFLSVTHGWTQPGLDATADVELPPGKAVWVVRGSGVAARDNAIFAGPVVDPAEAAEINFPTNAWTAAGWPLPSPGLARRDNPAPDQLGFSNATGGTRGDLADARSGDQLWVWRAGGGWDRYWLADNGDSSHPAHRRWFRNNDFADITLQPGDAFYYFNSTNRPGAVNFDWKAQP